MRLTSMLLLCLALLYGAAILTRDYRLNSPGESGWSVGTSMKFTARTNAVPDCAGAYSGYGRGR